MGLRVLVGGLDFGAVVFFFVCLVRPFIELDFLFLSSFSFCFDWGDDGRSDQTKEKRKEE